MLVHILPRKTQDLLAKSKWDVFDHPPCSLDLAPSDFHLFRQLKVHLDGQRFVDDDEVKSEVNDWPKEMDADPGTV